MVSPCQKPSASYFSISSADSRVRIVFMAVVLDDDIGRREFLRAGCRDDGLSVIVVLGGRVPLDGARPAVPALVLVHFGGLGVELGRHQAQTLGAGEVEAASRDAEAVFGLATQELGGQHQSSGIFFRVVGSAQWF